MARGKTTDGGEGRDRRRKLRDFSQSLPMSLLRGREAVMRYFRPMLRGHGLTEQQWRVLRALSTGRAMEATVLAQATFLLAPSLSRILRDLDQRGLVERRQGNGDLRRSEVSITRDGLDLIDRVAPDSEANYAEITARFGAERLSRLQAELRALEAALAAGRPDDAAPE
jgi:homoprotocatechuate degradation regulator HpaR